MVDETEQIMNWLMKLNNNELVDETEQIMNWLIKMNKYWMSIPFKTRITLKLHFWIFMALWESLSRHWIRLIAYSDKLLLTEGSSNITNWPKSSKFSVDVSWSNIQPSYWKLCITNIWSDELDIYEIMTKDVDKYI